MGRVDYGFVSGFRKAPEENIPALGEGGFGLYIDILLRPSLMNTGSGGVSDEINQELIVDCV